MKTLNLYIDDLRHPSGKLDWEVVRSSEEAISFIKHNGCPSHISFDHDLGGDDTAMSIVKWLVSMDLESNGTFMPIDFTFNVHSANPVGAKNIQAYLDGYLSFKANQALTSSD